MPNQRAADERPRVLIVDDDLMDRVMLVGILSRIGLMTILEAHDEIAGIDTAKRLRPDLIFLDVNMPLQGGLHSCANAPLNPRFPPWSAALPA